MSTKTTKPNQGPVDAIVSTGIGGVRPGQPAFSPRRGPGSLTGRWRPDVPFSSGAGLLIYLRREKGVTTGDVLRVPMRFQTPVLGEYSRPVRVNVATSTSIDGSQSSRVIGTELQELSIDTLLMDEVAADASNGLVVWDGAADPQAMIRELHYIAGVRVPGRKKITSQIVRLVITQPLVWGSTPLTDMLVRITSITPSQRESEVGTEYLTLGVQEYDEGEAGRRQRPSEKSTQKLEYSVGETLHEFSARSQLKRASQWRKIADANGIKNVAPDSAGELLAWYIRHHPNGGWMLTVPAP